MLKGFNQMASIKCPFNKKFMPLVLPQAGHGIDVTFLKAQKPIVSFLLSA